MDLNQKQHFLQILLKKSINHQNNHQKRPNFYWHSTLTFSRVFNPFIVILFLWENCGSLMNYSSCIPIENVKSVWWHLTWPFSLALERVTVIFSPLNFNYVKTAQAAITSIDKFPNSDTRLCVSHSMVENAWYHYAEICLFY